MPRKDIEAVIREHAGALARLPGVVAVGRGEHEGKPCIRVLVSRRGASGQLPESLEGYPVLVEESGGFRALD